MYCDKNRIYCNDCNRSYIEYNYSNHLRSRGHIDNVIKNVVIVVTITISHVV